MIDAINIVTNCAHLMTSTIGIAIYNFHFAIISICKIKVFKSCVNKVGILTMIVFVLKQILGIGFVCVLVYFTAFIKCKYKMMQNLMEDICH